MIPHKMRPLGVLHEAISDNSALFPCETPNGNSITVVGRAVCEGAKTHTGNLYRHIGGGEFSTLVHPCPSTHLLRSKPSGMNFNVDLIEVAP